MFLVNPYVYGQAIDPNLTLVLLHFAGADGSTTFIDSSPIPYTFVNNSAQISSFEIAAGFGSSGFFNNSGVAPLRSINTTANAPDLRNTDFTIESSIYPTALNFSLNEICGTQRSNGDFCYSLYINNSNQLIASFFGAQITHQNAINLNTKQHVALVRDGNTFALYLEGVKSTTIQTVSQLTIDSYLPTTSLKIGVGRGGVAAHFTGYIDEFRLRKEAVYTGNFTPPTTPFAY